MCGKVRLDCAYWTIGAPCWQHGIDAVAIAPYFGDGTYPPEWGVQPDGGLVLLFQSLGSADKQVDTVATHSAVMEKISAWDARIEARLARYHLISMSAGDSGMPSGGWFHQDGGWEASYAAALARYHLPHDGLRGWAGFRRRIECLGHQAVHRRQP